MAKNTRETIVLGHPTLRSAIGAIGVPVPAAVVAAHDALIAEQNRAALAEADARERQRFDLSDEKPEPELFRGSGDPDAMEGLAEHVPVSDPAREE